MDFITPLIREIGDNDGWYNAQKLLDKAPTANLLYVCGERRIGKTVYFQYLMCKMYQKYGKTTMWLRNQKVEFQNENFYESFLNFASMFPDLNVADWETEKDAVYDQDSNKVCEFQSVSTFSNRRGNASPDMEMMIFDEFMPESRKYPSNCATGIMSLTKTVFSGRHHARLFMLSNYVSAANPYFAKFRIYPNPKKDISVFYEGGIAIEVCRGYKRAIEHGNPWNRIYQAGGYQDYATADEDPLNELIQKVPKGAEMSPYVLLIGGNYYMIWHKNGYHYADLYKNKLNGLDVITPNVQEAGQGVRLIESWHREYIKEMFGYNQLRFRNPNVMYDILSIVFDAV